MKQIDWKKRSQQYIYEAALQEFGTYGYEGVNMENICKRHDISKGMMYHYFANKEELFLYCVEQIFKGLYTKINEDIPKLPKEDILATIKEYFMIREYYFENRPLEKEIFENAIIKTPKDLKDKISILRLPLKQMNHQFIKEQIAKQTLRDGISDEDAMQYLEIVDQLIISSMKLYYDKNTNNLNVVLKHLEKMLDMILFGIIKKEAV